MHHKYREIAHDQMCRYAGITNGITNYKQEYIFVKYLHNGALRKKAYWKQSNDKHDIYVLHIRRFVDAC